MSKKSNFGEDRTTHSRLVIKVPPPELIALRQELLLHPDIYEYVMKGTSFEDCLAKLGEKLDILLDGMYDGDKLCGMFVEALRNRRFHGNQPHLRARGLVAVELVETKDSVTVEVVKEGTIAPTAVIPEVPKHYSEFCIECTSIGDCLNSKWCDYHSKKLELRELPNPETQKTSSDLQSQAEESHPSLSGSVDSEDSSGSDTTDLPRKH